jgi:alanyl-tRNA synthetase
MMTSTEIRQQFLDFFKARGHILVDSAPIVVKNDPSLLFTNAGMNQFKDIFLGNRPPVHSRVADTQKCLRVSGKHNDLEEVGVDTYHHTMFEMLGNWSFGNPLDPTAGYFKKEAIAWSWELLTRIFRIEADRLYVTVFGGDISEGLQADEESVAEWEKWVGADRIIRCSRKDNFWEMGDTGPCGPCTEIHVDCRSAEERNKLEGRKLVNQDNPQVIEIWNNVFIQFNRRKDGTLESLPARHVDTGMGLERLARVLQNRTSNYDTDLFSGTISQVGKLTGRVYGYGDAKPDIAFRVLADHVRAIAFTIADGQLPSNTGAGYVIRRILRRAVRYYYSYLEYKKPLICQLIPGLAEQFRRVFPELAGQADFVERVVREEEEVFLRTLDKGISRYQLYLQGFTKKEIDGAFAFEMYDTYGFPVDLTQLMARESGLGVDMEGFGREMKKQKDRSRAAGTLDTEDWITLDAHSVSDFVGYDSLEIKSRIVKYRKVKAKGKEGFQLVLRVTPFYAESGGQVGDTGSLDLAGESIDVSDTRRENDLIIHYTGRLPAAPEATLLARVDLGKRRRIEAHHTATHLLHAALRKVLGLHVAQKGSLVNAEHLRFDFSHFAKVSEEELNQIESLVNQKIRENIPVFTREMPREEALALGAMALFGEKYGEMVRVVTIDPSFSVELCGGTHVSSTGQLGIFKIRHETAVAAGIRRIEAVAGGAAGELIEEESGLLRDLRGMLKHPADLRKSLQQILAENQELRKKIESLESHALADMAEHLFKSGKENCNGVEFISREVEADSPETLKNLSFLLKKKLPDSLILLAANIQGKPSIILQIGDRLVAGRKLDASRIIKEKIAPLIKGGGGGQKNLATAGGQDSSRLGEVTGLARMLLTETP